MSDAILFWWWHASVMACYYDVILLWYHVVVAIVFSLTHLIKEINRGKTPSKFNYIGYLIALRCLTSSTHRCISVRQLKKFLECTERYPVIPTATKLRKVQSWVFRCSPSWVFLECVMCTRRMLQWPCVFCNRKTTKSWDKVVLQGHKD